MASKLFMRRAILAAVAVITLVGSRPAFAQAPPTSDQCMTQLMNCYYWAALQSGFWTIWASGIDCETRAAECLRLAIMGR